MTLHIHPDRKIASCKICQDSIKGIEEAGRDLDRFGVWNIPEKIVKGKEYTIWKRKK